MRVVLEPQSWPKPSRSAHRPQKPLAAFPDGTDDLSATRCLQHECVNALQEALPGVRAAPSTEFQGQEADVVIYSMRSSRGEDVRRGLESPAQRRDLAGALPRRGDGVRAGVMASSLATLAERG